MACTKKETPAPVIPGLDYYPVSTGRFVIYEVDSTVYTELPRDTVHYSYLIKERIADSFTDNEGREAFRLERYIKKYDPLVSYDNIPWTIKEVWMLNASNTNIQVVENNKRYTKLIFPVEEKASWNGNAANTDSRQMYVYDYINKTETIGPHQLEKVLKVKHNEFRTLISYASAHEKYATGIGLVYREIIDLYANNIVPNVPVEGRIENGLLYKQTLLTYGYE